MRRVGILRCQYRVKPVLGEKRRVIGHIESDAPQAWRPDEDEERLDRFNAASQVAQSFANQVRAGKRIGDFHGDQCMRLRSDISFREDLTGII